MSELSAILRKWGAPGDYGYSTDMGKLLFELHQFNATVFRSVEKDAARYRWLRTRDVDTISNGGVFAGKTPENQILTESHLDDAVDAALASDGREMV